ncbi:MAG: Tim44/TimA family putative adaptor protein [Micavibrio sp.]
MNAEVLIYALVAAGLVFWLRSILGTRHGDERQRPNPFTAPPPSQDNAARPTMDPVDASILPAADMSGPLTLPKGGKVALDNAAVLEPVLMNIARMDRGFNLTHFAAGAQDAFVMIVEAFAAGDRELLKSLLSPDLYKAFEQAMTEREISGQTMVTEIHAIRKTAITDVQLKDRMAFVTLRFVADETSVIRDKEGGVIDGHPDRIQETIDIWTFGRDVRSKDPTWYLFATREEGRGATSIPSA